MNKQITDKIIEKIKAYDKIVISRHLRPDGDAVGSSTGLTLALRESFPEKDIRLAADDSSDYVSFLETEASSPEPEFYSGALLIVIDTATDERISNKNRALAAETVKIDHHIDVSPYGDISWVDDTKSAACEMIADFCFEYSLSLTPRAALCLYAGLVTDTGRFRYSSVSGDTLRCAGKLLDCGIDTDNLYARLYLDDIGELKYRECIYKKLRLTENGVAYLFVTRAMQKKFRLSTEQASNAVSFLDSIKGSIIWLAFIEYPDKTIRVRLRSRFVTINKLAEKYSGGGHDCASGATVKNKKEARALLSDADALIKRYKAENGDWL